MDQKNKNLNRRNFLKGAGAVSVGSVFAKESLAGNHGAKDPNKAEKETKMPQVPKRKFGRSDEKVPALSLGCMFDIPNSQIVLRNCVKWGVNYWDTAHAYQGGKSEEGIGKFIKRSPELRKNLFIVTKSSRARTMEEKEQRLQTSFKRMNTDYIDLLYGIHNCSRGEQLTDDLRKWAEEKKKKGQIRYFGFSTHKNMPEVLMAASKTDWIDGIMTSYNFRLMQRNDMKEAVQACNEKGIALIAMKVVGKTRKRDEEQEMLKPFIEKGYTPAQAKIKAVLSDERFCTACIRMENVGLVRENVEAVLDKKKLTKGEMNILKNYADATCSDYCAGCSNICEKALPEMPYVSEIMRYLMYYNSYGDTERARELFAEIPANIRRNLNNFDYRKVEAVCPQRIAVSKCMNEAVSKLA